MVCVEALMRLNKNSSNSKASAPTKIYAGVKNLRGRIRASISNNRRVFGKNTRAYFKYSRVFWVRWRGSLKRDELYEGPGIETECGRPNFCIKTC